MAKNGVIFKIASRYFLSKKSHSVINLISTVTIVSIAVPVAAMIILLSVHNGFESLIATLWGGVTTELVIQPVKGKYFDEKSLPLNGIREVSGVESAGGYIVDDVLLRYKGKQVAAKVYGVDSIYLTHTNLPMAMRQGGCNTSSGAVLGMGIVYQLGLKMNLSDPFTMIAPVVDGGFKLFGESAYYTERDFSMAGIFALDAERDAQLVFADYGGVAELFGREGSFTDIYISLTGERDMEGVKKDIQQIIGDGFAVKDIYEQNESEYKMIHSEKFAIYMIIMLVMIIASLTLVGTMVMLITEKREGQVALRMLGLRTKDLRSIFVVLGLILSFVGISIGLVLGLGVALAQQIWGFVPIYGSSLLVSSYPILVIWWDVLIVFFSVIIVTFLLSLISCRMAIKDK